MTESTNEIKTVLVVFHDNSENAHLSEILLSDEYRIMRAGNVLEMMETLERYNIHLVVSEDNFPEISTSTFLPYLRKRYPDLKLIVIMKNYSSAQELSLRKLKITHCMTWPVNENLLKSVVAKVLAVRKHDMAVV
jgi:DNA-binding NtrC family response regulator